jgi:hypothetical protein
MPPPAATPTASFSQALPTEDSTEGALARQLLRLIGPALQAPDGSLNAADALALGGAIRDARQVQLDSASQAFADAATYMLTELETLYGVLVDETLTDAARQARLTAFVRTIIGATPQNIVNAVSAYAGSAEVYEVSAADALASDPGPDAARGVFAFSVVVPTAVVLNVTKLAQVRAIIDRMRPAHTSFDVVNGVEGDGLRTETADSFIEVTGIGA